MSEETPSPQHPTPAARAAVAARFELPLTEYMQDWEYLVADSGRLDEFLDAYLVEQLTADERFVLMEIIIQACEDHPAPLDSQPRWAEVVRILRNNIALHAATISYWSSTDDLEEPLENLWRVTPAMRAIVTDLPVEFEL